MCNLFTGGLNVDRVSVVTACGAFVRLKNSNHKEKYLKWKIFHAIDSNDNENVFESYVSFAGIAVDFI